MWEMTFSFVELSCHSQIGTLVGVHAEQNSHNFLPGNCQHKCLESALAKFRKPGFDPNLLAERFDAHFGSLRRENKHVQFQRASTKYVRIIPQGSHPLKNVILGNMSDETSRRMYKKDD